MSFAPSALTNGGVRRLRRGSRLVRARIQRGNGIVATHVYLHSHLVGVYHCEGTARTVGLELISQLPPERVEDDVEDEDGRSQRRPP